jgi:kynurenine formamidase
MGTSTSIRTPRWLSRRIGQSGWLLRLSILWLLFSALAATVKSEPRFVDLSLLIAPDYPATWPANWPYFQMDPYLRIGPHSAYNGEILTIDGNTGTQLDFPPHSIPPPNINLPNAGPLGLAFSDKIPAWRFAGEACVVDIMDLLDKSANGQSPLVRKEHLVRWEKQHRPFKFGDVVLLRSGYSDKYYLPFPQGRRFLAEALESKTPAWPDPHPEAMEYLGSRGVMALGTDSPSMGPVPDLAEPTHYAGLKYGMIWTEAVTGLGNLPATGAFYCVLAPKHAGGATSESRAFAIVSDPLAKQLIESARQKRVIDLSVTLSENLPVWWPGPGIGNHRQPYITANFMRSPVTGNFQQTHIMDSQTGTHLVPPAYALPSRSLNKSDHSPQVQQWLTSYEQQYGAPGTSQMTTEQVPISQTCGWARVISVKHLIGKTDKARWPDSPEIKVSDIQEFEKGRGPLKAGEIVIFRSDYSEKCTQASSSASECMEAPLNGKAEGWPAPGPDVIVYLAQKGIRCVATDGPTLGGANPEKALKVYWALGTKEMVAVEYLTGVGKLGEKAYFLFAAPKIRGCHGGVGRAIALY